MTLFDIVMGLILGGFIWFFLGLMFEDFAMRKIKEKKFGIGSTDRLSKEDKQQFYIPLGSFIFREKRNRKGQGCPRSHKKD